MSNTGQGRKSSSERNDGYRGQQMQKPESPAVNPAGSDRRRWTAPVSEPRGSVADLVQIAKVSGGDDSSGGKRLVPD